MGSVRSLCNSQTTAISRFHVRVRFSTTLDYQSTGAQKRLRHMPQSLLLCTGSFPGCQILTADIVSHICHAKLDGFALVGELVLLWAGLMTVVLLLRHADNLTAE